MFIQAISSFAHYELYSGMPSIPDGFTVHKTFDTFLKNLDPHRVHFISKDEMLSNDFFSKPHEEIVQWTLQYLRQGHRISSLLQHIKKYHEELNPEDPDRINQLGKPLFALYGIEQHIQNKPQEMSSFRYIIQLIEVVVMKFFGYTPLSPIEVYAPYLMNLFRRSIQSLNQTKTVENKILIGLATEHLGETFSEQAKKILKDIDLEKIQDLRLSVLSEESEIPLDFLIASKVAKEYAKIHKLLKLDASKLAS